MVFIMIKKIWKGIACALAAFALFSTTAFAIVPYQSYTYNYWKEKKDVPTAYLPDKVYRPGDMKLNSLKNPSDLFVAADGKAYIADTDHNRVIILNADMTINREIAEITYNGQTSSLATPEGVYCDKDGELYICDTGNHRIIRLAADATVKQLYLKPESSLLDEQTPFQPAKVIVDKSKKLYVIAKGVNMGLLELSEEGTLDKFIGAPTVYTTPVEYFWKMIASKEQRSRMESYVPTEYNNLFLDSEGFIYVTNNSVSEEQILEMVAAKDKSGDSAPVKKLTLSGEDVLDRNGYFPPVGDLVFPVKNQDYSTDDEGTKDYLKESEKGPSSLVDVTASEDGTYAVLDSKRGQIFTYDSDGNLLFVFGGVGGQNGTFVSPVSICQYGEQYYVLDKVLGSITVFTRTSYGQDVLDAIQAYNDSDYKTSEICWNRVIQKDANSDIAYFGIGKIKLMDNDYQQAMQYFKLANRRDYYSKALKHYRNDTVGKVVGITVFAAIILIMFTLFVYRTIRGIIRVVNFGKDGER